MKEPAEGKGPAAGDALIFPDFDSYPLEQRLLRATVIAGGVCLSWENGVESALPSQWLREFSPDTATFHAVTREQKNQLCDLPADLAAESALVDEAGYLLVRWQPEGLESRYHPGWLWAHAPGCGSRLFQLPERRLWPRPASLPDAARHDGAAILAGDPLELMRWLQAIHADGLGLVNGLPVDSTVIPRLPELIGPIRPSNFGHVFEVHNLPDANTNANTALALAVHNDLATREYIPGLQFLYCMANGTTGGDSLLADGYAIARQLREESAEFHEVLSTLPIPFGTKDREYDHRYCAPVLEHDAAGQLSSIRHTYWLRSPMQGDFDTIRTFYAAYRRFQEIANDPDNQLRLRLQPGEMLAFDNRRMLHGRTAFDPASGERLLRGCYAEREELESRLRILYREQRRRSLEHR
jgi:gamma-butyrobetaine dioxygenase